VDDRLLTGLPRRGSRLRKQNNRDCRKAKQNADYDAEFRECGFGSGFLFHRMGVWVDCWSSSKRSGAYQRNFLFPVLLISLGSKTGTPFLAERAKKCQHYFWLYLQKRFGRRRHRPSNYAEFYGDL